MTILTPWIVDNDAQITYLNSAWFSILIPVSIWIISRGDSLETTNQLKEIKDQLNRIEDKIPNTNVEIKQELSGETMKNIITEWEVVIKTQMHFNDMIMKVRTATISFVVGVFSAAAYILQYDLPLHIFGTKIHASATIIIAGIVFLVVMFCVDYFYYYKMLIGAVKRGYKFDEEFQNMQGHRYFGMSSDIRNAISKKPGVSKWLVIMFYWSIVAVGGFILYAIWTGYTFWS